MKSIYIFLTAKWIILKQRESWITSNNTNKVSFLPSWKQHSKENYNTLNDLFHPWNFLRHKFFKQLCVKEELSISNVSYRRRRIQSNRKGKVCSGKNHPIPTHLKIVYHIYNRSKIASIKKMTLSLYFFRTPRTIRGFPTTTKDTLERASAKIWLRSFWNGQLKSK